MIYGYDSNVCQHIGLTIIIMVNWKVINKMVEIHRISFNIWACMVKSVVLYANKIMFSDRPIFQRNLCGNDLCVRCRRMASGRIILNWNVDAICSICVLFYALAEQLKIYEHLEATKKKLVTIVSCVVVFFFCHSLFLVEWYFKVRISKVITHFKVRLHRWQWDFQH